MYSLKWYICFAIKTVQTYIPFILEKKRNGKNDKHMWYKRHSDPKSKF